MWETYYLGIVASLKMVFGSINATNTLQSNRSALDDLTTEMRRQYVEASKPYIKSKSKASDLASIYIDWEDTVVKRQTDENGRITINRRKLDEDDFDSLFSLPDAIKYLYDTRPTRIYEGREREILKNILDSRISEKERKIIAKCANPDILVEREDRDSLNEFIGGNINTLILEIPDDVVVNLSKCQTQLRDEKSGKIIEKFKSQPKIFERNPSKKKLISEMLASAKYNKETELALRVLLESFTAKSIRNIKIREKQILAVENALDEELRSAKVEFSTKVANRSPGPITEEICKLAPQNELEMSTVEEKLRQILDKREKSDTSPNLMTDTSPNLMTDTLPNLLTDKLKKICAGLGPTLYKPFEFHASANGEIKWKEFDGQFHVLSIGKCIELAFGNVIFFNVDLVQVATTPPLNGTVHPNVAYAQLAASNGEPVPIIYYLVSVSGAEGEEPSKIVDVIMEKREFIYSPDKMLRDVLFEHLSPNNLN